MTYTMTIKGRNINVNTTTGTISGDTYSAKETLKEEFPGIRWDGSRKCWTLDAATLTARVEDMHDWLTRAYSLREVATAKATPATAPTKLNNGKCPRCGTYCYGDCTAR